ncbi:hypothetical protein ES705_05024 [subsurface metagenome]
MQISKSHCRNRSKMEGVILFADDHIFDTAQKENRLFNKLNKEFPVLGVNSLEMAQQAVKSIGAFSAIILDWNFDEITDEGVIIRRNAELFLEVNDFYSLIYIYSRLDLADSTKKKLRRKFGGRVEFRRKTLSSSAQEYDVIIKDLMKWKQTNKKFKVSFNWGITINAAVQSIFSEFSKADVEWIHDLYKTAGEEVNPEIEVVTLMQNVLSEKIIRDNALLKSIKKLAKNNPVGHGDKAKAVAKLLQRIYYTRMPYETEDIPIMTGDIFAITKDKKKCAILISPECDMRHLKGSKKLYFELLQFERGESKEILETNLFNAFKRSAIKTIKLYQKIREEADQDLTVNQKTIVRETIAEHDKLRKEILYSQAFNQTHARLHLLPSFYFTNTKTNDAAVIDFRKSKKLIRGDRLEDYDRICKLNSPFIQELRQRYLSYIGRIGVPPAADNVVKENIKNLL